MALESTSRADVRFDLSLGELKDSWNYLKKKWASREDFRIRSERGVKRKRKRQRERRRRGGKTMRQQERREDWRREREREVSSTAEKEHLEVGKGGGERGERRRERREGR
eukprot:scaffold193284_cov18-Tisochrysis_lutea.AAC.1